jgi:F-type H+-transporting ATPase subunit epsilon
MSYTLAIMTPEGRRFEGEVESLVAPGLVGSFGVLANHAPMIAALQSGIVQVMTSDGSALWFVIGSGIAEVDSDGVTLLADTAEKADNAADASRKLGLLRASAAPKPPSSVANVLT